MVRNEDGFWINTEYFRLEAKEFEKNGYYTEARKGTSDYDEYWHEQYKRCKEGYTVAGVKITGYHYFYLNFVQIKVFSKKLGRKVLSFPGFWDGDYNYFWAKEIARRGMSEVDYKKLHLDVTIRNLDGDLDMLVGKARRKGFSYKNAAVLTCDFCTIPGSYGMICAFDSKYLYPKGTMKMIKDNLSFLDEHTEFGKSRDYADTLKYMRASYKEYIGGRPIEKGYKSSIAAISFKDNPDAGRGDDASHIMVEEGGKFPNLKDTYSALLPSTESGIYKCGQMIIYGTSSMDIDGDTADFIDMFYNPDNYNLLPFENIWDEDAGSDSCSFFFPDFVGKDGHIDEQGNSDIEAAKAYEITEREKKRKSASSTDLLAYIVERPFSPQEAFLIATDNDFPTLELNARLTVISEDKAFKKKGDVVELVWDEGEKSVTAIPDLHGKLQPYWSWPDEDLDKEDGAVVLYERPLSNSPFGYYKIGYDPYRQDKADKGSKGCILVYRGYDELLGDGDKLVGEYYGRPETYDMVDEICLKLAVYYNAEVMFENEVTHPKDYFKSRGREHYLATQPQHAIDAAVKDSKVRRVYGMHMSDKLKDTAAKYLKRWLLHEHTFVDGEPVRNLDRIWSPALLQEIIRWNRKGNFDRVSTMFMLMYAIEEIGASQRASERSMDTVAKKLSERYRRQKYAKTNAYAGF